jgi:DNA polymerase alpha subunit A
MLEPALSMKLKGNTFSHAFGTNTTPLELFLLKRKLMGPCWIEIKNASVRPPQLSWCRLEVVVNDQKTIRCFTEGEENVPKDAPPFNIMSLNIRTVFEKGVNEIVAASAFIYNQGNLCLFLTYSAC